MFSFVGVLSIFVLLTSYFLMKRWSVFKSLPERPPYHFSIIDYWCGILSISPTLWVFGYLTNHSMVQWTCGNTLTFAAMIAGHYAGLGSGGMEYEIARSAGVRVHRIVYLVVFSFAGGSLAHMFPKLLMWILAPDEAGRIISAAL